MSLITITEALSEINLIKKKLADKRNVVQGMVMSAEHVPDPYANDGGSAAVVMREVQSMQDLMKRLVRIRAGISSANLVTMVTLTEGSSTLTQSVHDCLIWKREIVKDENIFLNNVTRTVKAHLDQASKQPQVYKDDGGAIHLVKTRLNIDYPQWMKVQAETDALLERLDGQLSLKNATVTIDV